MGKNGAGVASAQPILEVEPGGAQRRVDADPAELARFATLAERFWDADGPMRPLHLMNPLRLEYILGRAQVALGIDRAAPRPLGGISVLDVGCGAGLLTEPMARLGGSITGLDATAEMVEAATAHAAGSGLSITYQQGTTDDLVALGQHFDLVTALEVIEHVPDPHAFVSGLGQLVRPGGLVVISTLGRTLKSLLLAIGAAEYLLGWLPRGTHDWRRFVRPAELATRLRDAGLRPVDLTGVAYEPAYARFRLTRDTSVNYFMAAVRA